MRGWRWANPPNIDPVLNTDSQQARGLRAWWPALASYWSSRIYNLAYDRAGTGSLSASNGWVARPTVGMALDFNGTSGAEINLGSIPSHRFTDAISVFAWIYLEAIGQTTADIIFSISNNIAAGGWEFGIRGLANEELAFAYYDGA